MEPVTVDLPPGLRRRLRYTAVRRKQSETEVILEVLAQGLDPEPRAEPRLPLFSSGDSTLAERVDAVLEVGSDSPSPRLRPRAIFHTDDDPTLARRVGEALEGFGES